MLFLSDSPILPPTSDFDYDDGIGGGDFLLRGNRSLSGVFL